MAEKPSVAKELAKILSNSTFSTRRGEAQYNMLFEFSSKSMRPLRTRPLLHPAYRPFLLPQLNFNPASGPSRSPPSSGSPRGSPSTVALAGDEHSQLTRARGASRRRRSGKRGSHLPTDSHSSAGDASHCIWSASVQRSRLLVLSVPPTYRRHFRREHAALACARAGRELHAAPRNFGGQGEAGIRRCEAAGLCEPIRRRSAV